MAAELLSWFPPSLKQALPYHPTTPQLRLLTGCFSVAEIVFPKKVTFYNRF